MAVGLGGEEGGWVFSPALALLYLRLVGGEWPRYWRLDWDPGPAPHLPAGWPTAPLGRGLGRALSSRGEAGTSGIPREDSEVLSGVGFMALPAGQGKLGLAYFRRRSVAKCRLRLSLCL